MRILVVVPDSNMGGVTSSAVNFCNELSKRENEVYFLDMSGELLCKDKLEPGVNMAKLSKKSENWNLGADKLKKAKGLKKIWLSFLGVIKKLTIKSGLWYKLSLKKFKEVENIDVAVAYRQCDPCYSFVLNKVKAKKKMGFVHGELAYMGDISSWKKHMTRFDKIAYVSSAVQKQFVAVYPELEKNACTIYNMFNIEQIQRLSEEEPAIKFDKSIKNIVTVARIDNAFKQTHWIVEICKRLKESGAPEFHWYVLGDGPDYEDMLALSKEVGVDDVLTFAGNQANPYAIVKNADFTVLTSKSEAYPMVVIESFILKKPIVAAEFPSIFEMMKNGVHGIVTEQSVDSVCESVLKMLTNENGIADAMTEYLNNYEYTNDCAVKQFYDACGI